MNEKIHFDDFAEQVALEVGVDVDTAKDYIYTMFETIIEENERGEAIRIRNFGSFHPVHNKARQARNPQTGNLMTIPAHYHVNFKASETLSKIVNVKYGHLHPQVIEEERKNAMPVVVGGILVLVAIIAALFFILSGGEEEAKSPVSAPVIEQDAADRGMPVEEEKPAVEALPLPAEETSVPQVEEAPAMEETSMSHEAIGDDVVEGEEPEREPEHKPERYAEIPEKVEATDENMPRTPGRIAAPRVGEVGVVYTVQKYDTLTEISEDAYENSDFWPLIFSDNYLVVRDPDLIRPRTELALPGRPDMADHTDLANMYGGYIQAYKRYKGLGKDQKAIWLLFRGYMKINKEILDNPAISEADRTEVLDYIRRYDP